MAEIAETLWNHHMRTIRPTQNGRIVTVRASNGQCSMLIYALLHLTGYDLSMDDIKQLPSNCIQNPGPTRIRLRARHRNHHWPAGQGITMPSAGMAGKDPPPPIHKPDHTIVDHHTYAFMVTAA